MADTTQTRQLWLMRGISAKQSLMFSVAVEVEREGDYFAAALCKMQDHMAATGRDLDEAIQNARLLFMATVDDAMEKGLSIEYATGQAPVTLDLPVWMAHKFFHSLEQALSKADAEDDDEPWRFIPADEIGALQAAD